MPGKKKKHGALRPDLQQQDSMRRDIEAARKANAQLISESESGHDGEAEEGLDVADELMATLEARDKAAAKVQAAGGTKQHSLPIPSLHKSMHHSKSPLSGQSETSLSTSLRRSPADMIKDVGERIFGHHSPRSPPTLPSSPDTDGALASDMQRKGSIRERIFGAASPNRPDNGEDKADDSRKRIPRQKARKERKAAELEAQRMQAEQELKANGGKPDLAEKERVAIKELCDSLGVEMKEITPDGHCLYAAVADQLNLVGEGRHKKLDYQDARRSTAKFMREHADDFMPFISDSDEHMAGIENTEAGSPQNGDNSQQQHFLKYCDAVESTGVWGGQPEILALSRAYNHPIHVVQAGSPVVKVGTEECKGTPLMISYHRRMYGLGEHYNSLHKIKK